MDLAQLISIEILGVGPIMGDPNGQSDHDHVTADASLPFLQSHMPVESFGAGLCLWLSNGEAVHFVATATIPISTLCIAPDRQVNKWFVVQHQFVVCSARCTRGVRQSAAFSGLPRR